MTRVYLMPFHDAASSVVQLFILVEGQVRLRYCIDWRNSQKSRYAT